MWTLVYKKPVDGVRITHQRFFKRAFATKSIAEQMSKSESSGELRKTLGALDLILMGIGGIIGTGVFVLTGVAARDYAGPAVLLSYMISAFAALLAALSYTEFVVDLPVAGGAYNYISLTFGEFPAWIVACNMIAEYTFSSAAVARGFSSYLATLFGKSGNALRIPVGGGIELDPLATTMVILLSLILIKGIQESSRFNMVVTAINLLVVVFVLCAGFPHANPENFHPFAPFGIKGIFTGASMVFFSFVGFDMVATAAEEVRHPAVALPIGIVGSLLVCAVLYALMCAAISLMVPYQLIDPHAPFAAAFIDVGQPWAAKIVSIGALTGIVTSLLVGLLGQSRIYVVLGRELLLPPCLSSIHEKTQTPIVATIITMITAGLLAFLVDIETLASLVSIGTLFVFFCVSAGVVYRRYHAPDGAEASWKLPAILIAITASAVGFSSSYTFHAPWPVWLVFAVLWLLFTLTLYLLPVTFRPAKFAVPLSPLTPSLGMLATLHLIASLGWKAYVRFGVWFVFSTLVYCLYSVHHAEQHEAKDRSATESRESENGSTSGGGMEVQMQSLPMRAEQDSPTYGKKLMRRGSQGKLLGPGVQLSDEPEKDEAGGSPVRAATAGGPSGV